MATASHTNPCRALPPSPHPLHPSPLSPTHPLSPPHTPHIADSRAHCAGRLPPRRRNQVHVPPRALLQVERGTRHRAAAQPTLAFLFASLDSFFRFTASSSCSARAATTPPPSLSLRPASTSRRRKAMAQAPFSPLLSCSLCSLLSSPLPPPSPPLHFSFSPLLSYVSSLLFCSQQNDPIRPPSRPSASGPWKELSRVAGWSGMELESCLVLACDEDVTPEESASSTTRCVVLLLSVSFARGFCV